MKKHEGIARFLRGLGGQTQEDGTGKGNGKGGKGKDEVRMQKFEGMLQNLPLYTNRDRLRADLSALFRSNTTLQPQTRTPTRGDQSETYFFLQGVLPINYRGNS